MVDLLINVLAPANDIVKISGFDIEHFGVITSGE
jgi:hypothetical protein